MMPCFIAICQHVTGLINGFISIAEGIQGIVELFGMLTAATSAHAAASTTDAAATAGEAAAATANTARPSVAATAYQLAPSISHTINDPLYFVKNDWQKHFDPEGNQRSVTVGLNVNF